MASPATIEKNEETALVPQVMTPMDMIATATERGASVEVLGKLMDLQERWQANQARLSFEAAMAASRAELKPVIKRGKVKYEPKNGGKVDYEHETLADICEMVDPIFAKLGLSYRWVSNQNGPSLTITCIISHKDGHREEASLTAPNDTSGSKNPLQTVGSSATYLQRYTLKLGAGLAAAKDDDARSVSDTVTSNTDNIDAKITPDTRPADQNTRPINNGPAVLSEAQADAIRLLIKQSGADTTRLLECAKAESVSDILASDFDRLAGLLRKKIEMRGATQ